MYHKIAILLIFILSFSNNKASSENSANPIGIWTAINIDTEIWHNWGLSYELENRLYLSSLNVREFLLEVNFYYEFTDFFEIQLDHRLTNLGLYSFEGRSVNLHRNSFSVILSEENRRFELSYRGKFQTNEYIFSNSSDNAFENIVHRNRVEMEYNIRKSPHNPLLSYEVFSRIKSYNYTPYQWRIKVGSKLNLKGNYRIEFGYFLEDDFNSKTSTFHVFYTKFRIKFDT